MVSFAAGTDRNLAQTLLQNRVALAVPVLPVETQTRGVTIRKQSPDPLLFIALFSPDGRRDASYLTNYAAIQLKDELARVPGVAKVSIVGREDFAASISLDPGKLAARNVTVGDVTRALKQQEVGSTAGQPAGPGGMSRLTRNGRDGLMQQTQLEEIEIKADGKLGVTRLRDVASSLELGTGHAGFASLDGKPTAVLAVYPLERGSQREVGGDVRAKLSELRRRFPDGLDAFTGFDFSGEPKSEASGYLALDVDPPAGASVEMTARLLGRGDQSLRQLAGVKSVLALLEQPFDLEYDQPCLVVCLGQANGVPVDRERLIREIRREMYQRFIVVGQAASIRVRDLSGPARNRRFGYPIDFAICGPERPRVQELAGQLVARMSADPGLTDVWADLRTAPSLSVDIDKAKAASQGLALDDISASIQVFLNPALAVNISLLGREWPVRVQVGAGAGNNVDVWNQLKVRANKGEMVPLLAVAAFHREVELSRRERINFLPAVSITATPAGGLTQADARSVSERLAAEILPKQQPIEYRLVWLRESAR